jgi:hypothetical protein
VQAVVEGEENFSGREHDEPEVRHYFAALQDVERLGRTKAALTEKDIRGIHGLAMTGKVAGISGVLLSIFCQFNRSHMDHIEALKARFDEYSGSSLCDVFPLFTAPKPRTELCNISGIAICDDSARRLAQVLPAIDPSILRQIQNGEY